MKRLNLILLLSIIFFAPSVFCAEFNMNSYTSATKTGTKNRYRATEIYNTGISNTYTFGTQYSGQISDIETYFSYPFSANMTYRLTYNMNTDDFRNNFGSSYWWDCDHEMTNINATVQSVNYVSYKKVTFTFTPTEATTCIRVWLRSKNVASTAITGVSNWRLNNITIYDPEWQNGSSSSSGSQGTSPGSSGTSSTNNNDEIINNATENTHTIINNQNSNTQDIINNNNDNTKSLLDSQKDNSLNEINVQRNTNITNQCTNAITYDLSYGKNFNLQGVLFDGDALFYYTNDYIPIPSGTTRLCIDKPSNSVTGARLFVYDSNKNYLSYVNTANRCYTLPDNSYFFRFSSPVSSTTIFTNTQCVNRQEQNTNSINDNTSAVGNNIINNIAENAQNAINNATQNKNDIINNQNSNSQNEINSSRLNSLKEINNTRNTNITNQCSNAITYDLSYGKYVGTDGLLYDTNNESYYTNDYISIPSNTNYLCIDKPSNSVTGYRLVFYKSDKTFLEIGANTATRCVRVPDNASYFRFNSPVSGTTIFTNSQCVNRQEQTTNAINETNDYLKDDSDPSIDNSVLNDVFGRVHFTDPLSYLLTLPTQLINKIVSLSDTCSPIDLGALYGVHLTLPCINLENYLGSDLWGIIDVILSVGLLAVILKNFYDTISNLLTLGGEKEAKEKFSMPTPMDFLAMILGGDNR